MDSKDRLGLGGSTRASFIVDLKNGIVDARQEFRLFKQELQDATTSAQRFRDAMSSIKMGGGGGGIGGSSNQIAPDPEFTPPASQAAIGGGGGGGAQPPALTGGGGGMVPYSRGGTVVAYTPAISSAGGGGGGGGFTGGTNLTDFIKENPAAGALFAGAASGALFSASDSVEAQLLMQRAAFFNSAGPSGRRLTSGKEVLMENPMIGGTYDFERMRQLQERMSYEGTVLDKMDAMRSLVAAQSYGITGPNITQAGGQFGSVGMGVAQVSNLLPGIGAEGSMRAFGAMQQGRNVNMLRGIGIRLRDEQGNLKPPDQIIDDLWKKICRDYARAYGSDRKPSEREVLIGLQPGNSMDSMLDMYFGNDPMAKQLVANGLLFKAKTGGGAITKENIQEFGGTTAAVSAFSKRNAAAAQGLGQVANAGAIGYEQAAQSLTMLGQFMNMLDRFTGVLQLATRGNAFVTTLMGSGNDFLTKILTMLLGIKGKHAGGGVEDTTPYVVGEKGPELFIPKVDGVIIPNHLMGTKNRHEGGGVKHSHAGETLKESQVRSILKQAGFAEGRELDEAVAIARAESGFRTNAEGDKELAKKSNLWDYSIGLMQIRAYDDPNKDPKRDSRRLYDPNFNARSAYQIYKASGDWRAWYNSATKLGFKGGGSGGSGTIDTAEELLTVLGVDPASFDAKTLASVNALFKDPQYATQVKDLNSFINQGAGASGMNMGMLTSALSSGGVTHNYGGVVINVLGDNAKKIAETIKKMFSDEKILEKAASK
jgi:hypothetical protein